MSSVLPFDIISEIIDIVGANQDTNLLKELALVSHSFLQICSKHLFATVELYDISVGTRHTTSSKKGFIKLLKSRPDVVEHIRKLTYNVAYDSDNDHLLSPILPNLLRTIPRLNCLTITGSYMIWGSTLDSSLTSAFLHLMHLPTIHHIDLSYIHYFPLCNLTPAVNLQWLNLSYMHDEGSFENVQLEMMPKIREFHTSMSSRLLKKLLHAKMQDGRPSFNLMDIRRLSINFTDDEEFEDEQNIRYLLQNVKLLETLHISVGFGQNLVGILSLSARTLKVLDLSVFLIAHLPLAGLCEELEAMAGHNMLEALSFELCVIHHNREDAVGSAIQRVEKVLVKPGWSSLRQVSIKVSINCCRLPGAKVSETLQSLPDKHLSQLSKLESVALSYSAHSRCSLNHGE